MPYVNRHVDENDTAQEYTNKIFESTMANLELARKSLDGNLVNCTVDVLIYPWFILMTY